MDTEPAAVAATRQCFRQWNLEISDSDAEYVTGRTWRAAAEYLHTRYPLPLSVEDTVNQMLDCYRVCREDYAVPVPGAVEAVGLLYQEFPLALVSGSNRVDIEWALHKMQILDRFQFFLGAEDYPKSKPDPIGYQDAMRRLGVTPDQCLIFEDSTAGVQSGVAAGAYVVSVQFANHFGQVHQGTVCSVDTFEGVNPAWVRALPT
jgi:HAD superfamily hydrolase (TIGR01509 family)